MTRQTDETFSHTQVTALSLAGFVLFWWAMALVKGDAEVLPAPPEVLRDIWRAATEGDLIGHILATLRRVAWAFALAMGIGTALGVWLGRNRRIARWADPLVTVFLNLPAL